MAEAVTFLYSIFTKNVALISNNKVAWVDPEHVFKREIWDGYGNVVPTVLNSLIS